MTEVISFAKGRLNDLILTEWPLDRYRNAERSVPLRREVMKGSRFEND
ncbi:MAG: hypothetical protein U9Q81_06460 [Pseudomonadota bacterium]|nr:hypothetical protein [Pseudomonadota bacterium]